MGQEVEGGMWCPRCNAPRMGCGFRVSDAVPVVDRALLSFGAALGGGKREKYVCTTCGAPLARK
jgi:hypothetical protein